MRKILLSALACLSSTIAIQAQANKSIFFEVAGNGLAFSANFDSRLTKSEKGFGFRAGVGIIPGMLGDKGSLTIPFGINHLAGKAPHYFESGLGVTYGYKKDGFDFIDYDSPYKSSVFIFVPSIGYRRAKTGKSFQFRFCITPVIANRAYLYAGLSVGFRF